MGRGGSESHNKAPRAPSSCISSAGQKIILFCMLYGWGNKDERRTARKQLAGYHGHKPDLFTVSPLVTCRDRLLYEYAESVREGAMALIRMLPGCADRDALVMFALSPHRYSSRRVWRWPNAFSSKSRSGIWRGRISPELEDQLASSGIAGSAHSRPIVPAN